MIAPLILESRDEDLWTSWESGYPKRFNSFTVSVTDAGVVSEGPLPSTLALCLRAPCHRRRLQFLDKIKQQQGYVGGERLIGFES